MATTRTITGTLYEADGTTVANGSTVRFKLIRGAWSATEHAIPSEVSATTTNGAFSITVYTPAEYKVYLPGGYQFNLTVPEGAAADLESLRLAQEDLPNLTSILDDWLDALALTALADGPGAYDNGKYLQSTADGWAWAEIAAGASAWDDITGKPTTIDGYGLTAEIAALIAPFATSAALTAHTGDTNNPHSVTAAQVGALTQAAGDARYGRLGAANTWALAQTFTGQIISSAGTAGAPGITSPVDGTSGILFPANNQVGMSVAGVQRLLLSPSLLTVTGSLTASGTVTGSGFTGSISTGGTTDLFSFLSFTRNSPGAAAAGFGAQIPIALESSTTVSVSATNEMYYWADATHASRTSAWGIQTVYNAGALTETIRAQRTGAADSTGLWLYDETAASLKQVTRGAADSGGAGFRLLRVAN